MSKFDFIKDGEIGLVTTDNGRIVQLCLIKEMHQTLMLIIASFSKETPLIKLGE